MPSGAAAAARAEPTDAQANGLPPRPPPVSAFTPVPHRHQTLAPASARAGDGDGEKAVGTAILDALLALVNGDATERAPVSAARLPAGLTAMAAAAPVALPSHVLAGSSHPPPQNSSGDGSPVVARAASAPHEQDDEAAAIAEVSLVAAGGADDGARTPVSAYTTARGLAAAPPTTGEVSQAMVSTPAPQIRVAASPLAAASEPQPPAARLQGSPPARGPTDAWASIVSADGMVWSPAAGGAAGAQWRAQFASNAQRLLRETQQQVQELLFYKEAYEAAQAAHLHDAREMQRLTMAVEDERRGRSRDAHAHQTSRDALSARAAALATRVEDLEKECAAAAAALSESQQLKDAALAKNAELTAVHAASLATMQADTAKELAAGRTQCEHRERDAAERHRAAQAALHAEVERLRALVSTHEREKRVLTEACVAWQEQFVQQLHRRGEAPVGAPQSSAPEGSARTGPLQRTPGHGDDSLDRNPQGTEAEPLDRATPPLLSPVADGFVDPRRAESEEGGNEESGERWVRARLRDLTSELHSAYERIAASLKTEQMLRGAVLQLQEDATKSAAANGDSWKAEKELLLADLAAANARDAEKDDTVVTLSRQLRAARQEAAALAASQRAAANTPKAPASNAAKHTAGEAAYKACAWELQRTMQDALQSVHADARLAAVCDALTRDGAFLSFAWPQEQTVEAVPVAATEAPRSPPWQAVLSDTQSLVVRLVAHAAASAAHQQEATGTESPSAQQLSGEVLDTREPEPTGQRTEEALRRQRDDALSQLSHAVAGQEQLRGRLHAMDAERQRLQAQLAESQDCAAQQQCSSLMPTLRKHEKLLHNAVREYVKSQRKKQDSLGDEESANGPADPAPGASPHGQVPDAPAPTATHEAPPGGKEKLDASATVASPAARCLWELQTRDAASEADNSAGAAAHLLQSSQEHLLKLLTATRSLKLTLAAERQRARQEREHAEAAVAAERTRARDVESRLANFTRSAAAADGRRKEATHRQRRESEEQLGELRARLDEATQAADVLRKEQKKLETRCRDGCRTIEQLQTAATARESRMEELTRDCAAAARLLSDREMECEQLVLQRSGLQEAVRTLETRSAYDRENMLLLYALLAQWCRWTAFLMVQHDTVQVQKRWLHAERRREAMELAAVRDVLHHARHRLGQQPTSDGVRHQLMRSISPTRATLTCGRLRAAALAVLAITALRAAAKRRRLLCEALPRVSTVSIAGGDLDPLSASARALRGDAARAATSPALPDLTVVFGDVGRPARGPRPAARAVTFADARGSDARSSAETPPLPTDSEQSLCAGAEDNGQASREPFLSALSFPTAVKCSSAERLSRSVPLLPAVHLPPLASVVGSLRRLFRVHEHGVSDGHGPHSRGNEVAVRSSVPAHTANAYELMDYMLHALVIDKPPSSVSRAAATSVTARPDTASAALQQACLAYSRDCFFSRHVPRPEATRASARAPTEGQHSGSRPGRGSANAEECFVLAESLENLLTTLSSSIDTAESARRDRDDELQALVTQNRDLGEALRRRAEGQEGIARDLASLEELLRAQPTERDLQQLQDQLSASHTALQAERARRRALEENAAQAQRSHVELCAAQQQLRTEVQLLKSELGRAAAASHRLALQKQQLELLARHAGQPATLASLISAALPQSYSSAPASSERDDTAPPFPQRSVRDTGAAASSALSGSPLASASLACRVAQTETLAGESACGAAGGNANVSAALSIEVESPAPSGSHADWRCTGVEPAWIPTQHTASLLSAGSGAQGPRVLATAVPYDTASHTDTSFDLYEPAIVRARRGGQGPRADHARSAQAAHAGVALAEVAADSSTQSDGRPVPSTVAGTSGDTSVTDNGDESHVHGAEERTSVGDFSEGRRRLAAARGPLSTPHAGRAPVLGHPHSLAFTLPRQAQSPRSDDNASADDDGDHGSRDGSRTPLEGNQQAQSNVGVYAYAADERGELNAQALLSQPQKRMREEQTLATVGVATAAAAGASAADLTEEPRSYSSDRAVYVAHDRRQTQRLSHAPTSFSPSQRAASAAEDDGQSPPPRVQAPAAERSAIDPLTQRPRPARGGRESTAAEWPTRHAPERDGGTCENNDSSNDSGTGDHDDAAREVFAARTTPQRDAVRHVTLSVTYCTDDTAEPLNIAPLPTSRQERPSPEHASRRGGHAGRGTTGASINDREAKYMMTVLDRMHDRLSQDPLRTIGDR